MANQDWVFNADSDKWESRESETVLKAQDGKRVKTLSEKSSGENAQQKITGYCTCGRRRGLTAKNPYCSRYCYLLRIP